MRRTPGRIRTRLSAMLAAQGLVLRPEEIDCQEGPLYRNPGNDLARWFGYGCWQQKFFVERGTSCHVASWGTMTECVKFGFTISPGRGNDWSCCTVVSNE